MLRRSLALSLLTVVLAAGNAFAGAEARITGKVVDASTKKPLANVKLTAVAVEGKNVKLETKTKKDGTYALYILDGTIKYKFTWSLEGYQPYEETKKLQVMSQANVQDVELASSVAVSKGEQVTQTTDPAVAAYNEGAVLANEGKIAEAVAKMEAAIAANPELYAAHTALAKLQLRQKAYPQAIVAAMKALEGDPDDTDMHAVLFDAYTATGDKAKANEYKKKLPANPAALFNDAAKAINSGKDPEAEPLLKAAISADANFAPAYYELGMLYVRAGKNSDARTNLQKYLELEPKGKDAATAKEMLAYVK